MNKENNRTAAGLRRSAVAERIKLREEWSALKGNDKESNIRKKHTNILKKKQDNNIAKDTYVAHIIDTNIGAVNRRVTRGTASTSYEALRGVVALVDVGAGSRALALRAALSALGATVVPAWNHLVTHLVWSHDGCRNVRGRARALACRVVSPLWVEACAASGRRLPEDTFPAPSRPSDLPSPRTLRIMLKKAEMENISLAALLSDSTEDDDSKKLTLRMSSESDTSNTSANTSANTSRDTSHNKTETRVNTAPRRPPTSIKTQPPKKSKRKLFTQKDPDLTKGSAIDSDADRTPARAKQLTYEERRELARAGRLARRLLRARSDTPARHAHAHATDTHTYRVVLTGMSRSERQAAHNAIRALNGRIQKQVNKSTTHVLLGSCKQDSIQNNLNTTNMTNRVNEKQNIINFIYNHKATKTNISGLKNITSEMTRIDNMAEAVNVNKMAGIDKMASCMTQVDVTNVDNPTIDTIGVRTDKLRTVNALLGAARGCRVLYAKWALDSLEAKQWLHHYGYEVPHLRKIAMKARVERQALGRMRSEYAYDVFNGMRVRISPNADQRDAIVQLLSLCGAVVQDGGGVQNGGDAQNGRDYDIIIGVSENEVSSKWVFDSVAAARMRTTRKYTNKIIPESSESLTQ
ncbi:PREDICTED: uncharacterized protein LOC106116539 [Papilio xuthus]|uniref:Uncharacterized protein LOC106116539 n=1 Tax=Papilio xuthus TaxID=66420 RepID=A0AAJ6Z5P3_PAPXU|nr:PREDICTED: uncharacterized protein LOC106116539 [Papilio xuthus]